MDGSPPVGVQQKRAHPDPDNLRNFEGSFRFVRKPPNPSRTRSGAPCQDPSHPHPLVLALRYQALLDLGGAASKSVLARQVGISRERLNQILALTRLAPEIQRAILELAEPDRWRLSERRLRRIAALPSAEDQM